ELTSSCDAILGVCHSSNILEAACAAEGTMKLNHFALVNGSKIDSFGRRKKDRDATRIDQAIKTSLDQLEHHAQAQAEFLGLLNCVRGRTPLLKPSSGYGPPGWVAP